MREQHKHRNSSLWYRLRHLISVSCLFLMMGCGSNSGGEQMVDSTHVIGLQEKQSIIVDNIQREYQLYLPAEPAAAKLVLILHGNGGSSEQVLGLSGRVAPYKVWMDIALRENLVLVVPDGQIGPNGKQGWNDCRNDAPTNPAVDDVAFMNALVDEVQAKYGNSEANVYSVGTSNGGLMTLRLADAMPQRLSAIAVVVASKPVNSECVDSSVPLPVLFMNGTDDPILPYSGGQIGTDRGIVLSTIDTINFWIDRNQVDTDPVQTVITDIDQIENSTVIQFSYVNGANEATVQHFEVVNGGHTEPSMQERYSRIFKLVVGEQNGDIEMAEEIWKFFKVN